MSEADGGNKHWNLIDQKTGRPYTLYDHSTPEDREFRRIHEKSVEDTKNKIKVINETRVMPLPSRIYDHSYYLELMNTSVYARKQSGGVYLMDLTPYNKETKSQTSLPRVRIEGEMTRGGGGYYFTCSYNQLGNLVLEKVSVPPIDPYNPKSPKTTILKEYKLEEGSQYNLFDDLFDAAHQGRFIDNKWINKNGDTIDFNTPVGLLLSMAVNIEDLEKQIDERATNTTKYSLLNALSPNPNK